MIHCRDWPDDLGDIIRTPDDLHAFLADVKTLRDQGDLIILQASTPIDDIKPDRPWPDDMLSWTLQCRETAKVFELGVDTYHGRVSWRRSSAANDGMRR